MTSLVFLSFWAKALRASKNRFGCAERSVRSPLTTECLAERLECLAERLSVLPTL